MSWSWDGSCRQRPSQLCFGVQLESLSDSTGMKLWKKRWFVLCDMCLFYYRDDKEDSILGSILLPSFHVSMLSVDDHISRKYAFKVKHKRRCSQTGLISGGVVVVVVWWWWWWW
ncbi:hypothetical protein F7725_021490 [Dissostichus mawsoni]|uniref:PH domain-containing protein n=1 Tax=Dissostichus mawsoni TaxID=36200 RepID=A0A7J5ZD86_DISMA|nr:hypothetical protein F7725_021490 [Dissostichus mawsoni]